MIPRTIFIAMNHLSLVHKAVDCYEQVWTLWICGKGYKDLRKTPKRADSRIYLPVNLNNIHFRGSMYCGFGHLLHFMQSGVE
jgi:hypothetical protein